MAIDMKLENVLEMNPGEAPVLCFGTTLTNAQCSVPISTRWRAHEARISYLLRKTKWQHERARRSSTSQSSHSSSDVIRDEVLEELASFMLCFRHNEKQGPKIVKKWRREIELRLEKSSRSPALSMSQGTLSSSVHLRERLSNPVPILQRMSARIEARYSRQERVTLTGASSVKTTILSSRRHQTARNSSADHQVSSRTRQTQKEASVTNCLTANSKRATTTALTRKPISNKKQKKELHPKKTPEEKKEEKRTIGSRLPIKPGDECSICFETLLKRRRGRTVENGSLAWCQNECGSNYHQACISKWIDHSSRQLVITEDGYQFGNTSIGVMTLGMMTKEVARCPSCRAIWVSK
ncbi:hypothetical protein BGW36DRAFT_440507 [Talaromyces proteolyticus]|uniref:RING-type domain-containing protein n=1 Tax=Talaromyces proteolyticus TaxID=1131652 RepID=A0AAD4KGF9_9EURO|nr:uncharacterized protein BGW36DRAFT_440507 [Talaromyces proteolyticus]KAH8689827.1 hypothetical protein BGW36DRAFT_440507 [Talaromyces proteolyticus]